MLQKKIILSLIVIASLIIWGFVSYFQSDKSPIFCNYDADFISYEVDLQEQNLKMYWKDEDNQPFKSIANLKNWLDTKGEKLIFAMNAGMFKADNSPQGLFIQEGKLLTNLDTDSARGNFYLKPNGVFYTKTDKSAIICKTEDFIDTSKVQFATQSGPMLVIEGQIHSAFTPGSSNIHIRNGVGILPNKQVLFAMSKKEINLYDFATFFKDMGCKNALYLDGFVSRTYLPEKKWIQTDGNFGAIIGVCE